MYLAKHGKTYLRLRRPINFFKDWLGEEKIEKIISSLPQRDIEEDIKPEELLVNQIADEMRELTPKEADAAFYKMMEEYMPESQEG